MESLNAIEILNVSELQAIIKLYQPEYPELYMSQKKDELKCQIVQFDLLSKYQHQDKTLEVCWLMVSYVREKLKELYKGILENRLVYFTPYYGNIKRGLRMFELDLLLHCLKFNNTLERLDLYSYPSYKSFMSDILLRCYHIPTLQYIMLGDSILDDQLIPYVFDLISNGQLKVLKLRNTKLSHVIMICDYLQHNSTLTHLIIENSKFKIVSPLSSKLGSSIINLIKHNKTLLELTIRGYDLGDNIGKMIAENLLYNSFLQLLDLRGNNFKMKSVKSFEDCLKHNGTLLEFHGCTSLNIRTLLDRNLTNHKAKTETLFEKLLPLLNEKV